jgi:phosphoglycolate phosphatase-like HAD superfamily hydrolase
MIKSVIFDVDGVLIDSFEANLKFYQDLLSYAGYQPPTRDTFLKLFHMTMTDVIRILINKKDEKEVKRIWLLGKNRVVPYPNHLLTFPDNYEQVIENLNNKYMLGIVTSRIKGGVFKIPQLSKLEKYFHSVVYYEDTEKHKPDPEPLLLAIKRLKIKPEEAVYIGDTESDLIAGNNAGIKIIIYSKNKISSANDITSDFSKIPEIVDFLTKTT